MLAIAAYSDVDFKATDVIEKKILFMKKITTLLFISIALITGLQAQMRNLPGAVTDSFKAKYPNAKTVSWKDNLTNFEAGFKNGTDTVEMTAQFNNKGEWLQTTKKMSFAQLNNDVQDGFHKSKYTGWEIKDVKQVDETGKETVYKIFVRKNTFEKKYLYFTKQGQLKKEAQTL